jgi:hypothetical protein
MRADAMIRTEGMKALRNHPGVVEADKFIPFLVRYPEACFAMMRCLSH